MQLRGFVNEPTLCLWPAFDSSRFATKLTLHISGKFKTGIRNFSREIKPLSPEELMELLKSRDHCKEVHKSNDFGITDQELDMLLDRSDMYEEFEKSKGGSGMYE